MVLVLHKRSSYMKIAKHLLIFLITLIISCGEVSKNDDAGISPGILGGPCLSNGTCTSGLRCENNQCVKPRDSSPPDISRDSWDTGSEPDSVHSDLTVAPDVAQNDLKAGPDLSDASLSDAPDGNLDSSVSCPPDTNCIKYKVGDGGCVPIILPKTALCDDSNPCTKDDKCDGKGTCIGSKYSCTPVQCESASICDGKGGCIPTFLKNEALMGVSWAERRSLDENARCTTRKSVVQ